MLRFSYFLIRVETLSIAGQTLLRASSYEPGFRDLALPIPRCVHMRGQASGRKNVMVPENLTCARKLFLYNLDQFTVHDTSHHICKQCLRKLQKRRGLRTRKAFRRKPAKETKIFI